MADTTYVNKVYHKQGSDEMVVASGGAVTVESGGVIEIKTGGDITANGVSLIDEIAALSGLDSGELAVLNGVTPGTVLAGKAIVTTTDKHIDALVVSDGGLALGAGAGTAITSTAAEVNKTDGIPATGYLVAQASVLFTQTSGNGTYTGTIALPAGSNIIDVAVHGLVLWDASTSASMVVGDGSSANGFFTATDLKATDLLGGEVNNIEHPGGLAGAYIAAEQRVLYEAGARNVIGVITQVGTGTAGRTLMTVTYCTPTAVAASKV